MGTDHRFLTLSDLLYGYEGRPWTRVNLSTSYRITVQMAEFINKTMLHQKRLLAAKNGEKKPVYLLYDNYKDNRDKIFEKVFTLIKEY